MYRALFAWYEMLREDEREWVFFVAVGIMIIILLFLLAEYGEK